MWSNSFMPASVRDGDEKNIVIPNEFHTPLPRKRHQNSDCVLFPRSNKMEKVGNCMWVKAVRPTTQKVFSSQPQSLEGRATGRQERGGGKICDWRLGWKDNIARPSRMHVIILRQSFFRKQINAFLWYMTSQTETRSCLPKFTATVCKMFLQNLVGSHVCV